MWNTAVKRILLRRWQKELEWELENRSRESKLFLAQVNRNQTRIHSCLTKPRVTLIHYCRRGIMQPCLDLICMLVQTVSASSFWTLVVIWYLPLSVYESFRVVRLFQNFELPVMRSVSYSFYAEVGNFYRFSPEYVFFRKRSLKQPCLT